MTIGLAACSKDTIEFGQGDLKIRIEPGEAYLHDFKTKTGIKLKNPPQIAVWLEDPDGNYLSTVYVTRKMATQGWISAKGNRRKEALPHWCHTRGVKYDDGLYLPTKRQPLPDDISGATPRKGFVVKSNTADLRPFVVKVEVNHSTDFNEHYPQEANIGDANYSGGPEGSGQPALVYRAEVTWQNDAEEVEAVLVGHSSPDGSDGLLYTDMTGLTSALKIIQRITITKISLQI